MKERRRYRRLKAEVRVRWKKLSDSDQAAEVKDAMSKDVSEGGLCLVMEEKEVEIGDRLFLEIELPDKTVISAKTSVVWVMKNIKSQPWEEERKSYDVGVKFFDIDPNHVSKLEEAAFFITGTDENKK